MDLKRLNAAVEKRLTRLSKVRTATYTYRHVEIQIYKEDGKYFAVVGGSHETVDEGSESAARRAAEEFVDNHAS